MEREKIQGALPQTRLPNESANYIAKREELRVAEIALMRQREKVAALRRQLPPGAPVQDYEFEEGPPNLGAGDTPIQSIRLSRLFSKPGRSLVLYHFMFGKRNTEPCPMCTMWIDGYNGIAHHLAQKLDFAIVAAADLPALRAYGRKRGWHNLRLLSCGDSAFKYDLLSEDREGNQDSTISVFSRANDGTLSHFYSSHPWMADDIDQRGIDLLCAVYNVFDLTPEGRGDWFASLDYGADALASRR